MSPVAGSCVHYSLGDRNVSFASATLRRTLAGQAATKTSSVVVCTTGDWDIEGIEGCDNGDGDSDGDGGRDEGSPAATSA